MTEETRKATLSISNGKLTINVEYNDWMHTISTISEGVVKLEIFALLERNITYIPEIGRWFPFIPESLSEVKERIILALLITHPTRILRPVLSAISSVKGGSLGNYLTKEELGVKQYIDENKEGICLNQSGCVLALEILTSLEKDGDDLENE